MWETQINHELEYPMHVVYRFISVISFQMLLINFNMFLATAIDNNCTETNKKK